MARRSKTTISDMLQTSLDPNLHRVQMNEVLEQFDQVIDSKVGRIVLITGREDTGKTVLAGQCIAALSHRRERPLLVTGGFERSNSPGYVGWLLPDHALDLPTILTGLGQILSSAAAAASTAIPSGAGQFGVSLAAFTGQTAQTIGFAANILAENKRELSPETGSSVSPEDLLYVVRSLCASGRPVVLCLDDLHLAHPPLHWCRLFLKSLMGPLLAQNPILLIAIAESDTPVNIPAPPVVPTAECFQTLRELCQEGIANEVRVHPLTPASLEAWLGAMDDNLATDLIVCAGSAPGWIERLIAEWRSNGAVRYDAAMARWRYTAAGRNSAKTGVADFIRVAIWQLADGDVDVFNQINRVLRTASLEGTVFTADAVAKVLGYGREELVDWLDEHLTSEAVGANAPLEEAGFVKVDDGESPEGARYLCKYRFRSKLIWSALDAQAHHDEWEGMADMPAMAAAYAEALIQTYSRDAWRVSRRIASLCRLAAREDSARFYEQLWDLVCPAALYRQILHEELEAVAKATGSEQSWDVWRAVSAARRIFNAAHTLEGTCEQFDDFTGFQVAYMLTGSIAKVGDGASRLVSDIRVESLAGLGRLSFSRGRVGNAAVYSKYAADAYGVSGFHLPQAYALLLTAGALSWCMGYLASENSRVFDEGIWLSGYPELDVPDELWFVDQSRRRRPEIADVRNIAEITLNQAKAIISQVAPGDRQELGGQYFQTCARVKDASGDTEAACDLLRRSIAILPANSQKQTESWILLGQFLFVQKKYYDAEGPAREGLRGCIRNRRMVRAVAPLWHLFIILMNTQREAEAFNYIGPLLYLSSQVGEYSYASMGWDELGVMLHQRGHDRSDVLECLAISIAAGTRRISSQEQNFNIYASNFELSQKKREVLLADARRIWSEDHGIATLERILGVTASSAEAFFAAQGIAQKSDVGEIVAVDPAVALIDFDR